MYERTSPLEASGALGMRFSSSDLAVSGGYSPCLCAESLQTEAVT